jgi:aquaporin Z
MRKLSAEAFGTFVLVFAGTGAIVVNEASSGAVTHVGVSLTFGLVVLALIHSLGDVSGCHVNPAVTLGFWISGRFPASKVPGYLVAQAAGALAASASIRLLFPESATLGATLPVGGVARSFFLEAGLTLFLMFVILGVSTGAKEKGLFAGVAVGSVIGMEALFAGPVCGASMNPARSLGPAVASGRFEHLWLYLTAPPLGAALAVALSGYLHGGGEEAEDEADPVRLCREQ